MINTPHHLLTSSISTLYPTTLLDHTTLCHISLPSISRIIQPCDVAVNDLMSKADELVREKHHDALNIQRKVSSVEKRWQRFLTNVEEYRGLLEAAVEFYQLYEQVGLAVMKFY